MKSSTLLALLLTSILTTAAYADVVLGSTSLLRHREDLDVLKLSKPVCGLSALKIQIQTRAADIDHIAVQYGNGNWDELLVRDRFGRGSESRWIDLRGNERCIQTIAVVGESMGLPGRQATVIVLGK
jgi:hypothetical protein